MQVMVLGATGHIGTAFCHHLVQQGHQVTAVSRHPDKGQALASLNLSKRAIDLNQADFDSLFNGIDLVIDAAAPYPLDLKSDPNIVPQSHARYQRLLEAVTSRSLDYLYISSFITLNRPQGSWQRLTQQLATRSHPYYIVKQRLEQLVLGFARQHKGIRVYCPSACVGPWDQRPVNHCLIPQLIRGGIPLAASATVNMLDVRDLARLIVEDYTKAPAATNSRKAVYGHNVNVKSFVLEVCQQANCKIPPVVPVPSIASNLGLLSAEFLATAANLTLPVPALPVLLLNEVYNFTQEEFVRPTGVLPMSTSIRDAIAYYKSVGYC